MKRIKINTSRPYDVIIGSHILPQIGEHISALMDVHTVAIISDTNAWQLYGANVESSLLHAQLHVVHHIIPAGESSKTFHEYMNIVNFLAENHITRTDVVVALGGGVVGDIVGFAAATYLRGIRYVQIPTSLLAMVDSSVGGKTAIDLPAGKNLLGVFHQPSLVLCDVDTLHTLPQAFFSDGCAEIIKYGVLYDPGMLEHLTERVLDFDCEYIIARCITLKASAVECDEFDTGMRQKLNFGHTVGHAVEILSQYALTHGQAVSIGMSVVAKAALAHGYCSTETAEQIFSLLTLFGLPTQTQYTAEKLYQFIRADKKRSGHTLNLIVPRQIGQCDILTMPIEQLQSFIEAGL